MQAWAAAFAACGFREIAQPSPRRLVVRKELIQSGG
jgi:hypothetical protein